MSAVFLRFPYDPIPDPPRGKDETYRDFVIRMTGDGLKWMDKGELSAAGIYFAAAARRLHEESAAGVHFRKPRRRRRTSREGGAT